MVKKKPNKDYLFYSNKYNYGGYSSNLYKHDWKTPAWSDEDYDPTWQLTPTWNGGTSASYQYKKEEEDDK